MRGEFKSVGSGRTFAIAHNFASVGVVEAVAMPVEQRQPRAEQAERQSAVEA